MLNSFMQFKVAVKLQLNEKKLKSCNLIEYESFKAYLPILHLVVSFMKHHVQLFMNRMDLLKESIDRL